MAGLNMDGSRVAVVTGGASGIGKAIVHALIARSVRVAILDVDEKAMNDLAVRSDQVFTYPTDVADWVSVQSSAATVLEDLGRVDVLCANAGIASKRIPLWRQDPTDVERVLRVNMLGLTNSIRAFVPSLVAQREGHVVVTGSYLAFATRSGGGNGAYAASKHAGLAITEVLAHELAQFKIPVGVSIVGPGPVATPLQARATTPDESGDVFPPVERILDFVTAEDVAAATLSAIEDGHELVLVDKEAADYVRGRLTARREAIVSV